MTMKNKGFLHKTPANLQRAIESDSSLELAWNDITPLARNEWICWISSAKKLETRSHRLSRACRELKEGKRRPCCWQGCSHKKKKTFK